jgi:hypothetical protein
MPPLRRHLVLIVGALLAAGPLAAWSAAASNVAPAQGQVVQNQPSMVEANGRLRFDYGPERMVAPGGLQPFLLCTRTGALVVQAQSPNKPFPTARMHYPSAIMTTISRDAGRTWTEIPLTAGDNGLNAEGGMIQLRDGTILALDTYATPGGKPGEGLGWLYTSKDDWRSLQGPRDITFDLPKVNFHASSDDGGRPHAAERLHRRILELPNGDLLTTLYGQLEGDNTPSTYTPTMMKSRVMVVRSKDRGNHWTMISTISASPPVGTEGFGEPVIARVSDGAQAGRLICLMRTGRNLYESISDDQGVTWSPAYPRIFAGLDVNRTELWVDMFRTIKGRNGRYLDENNPDELRGAVVDPDLITLRSGLLVAAFGVRIPQKACWPHGEHPWNGNYLAVSQDHGATWPNVIRLTSGVPTTHYMGVEETPQDNELFVVYDHSYWGQPGRYTYGRTVKINVKSE